MLVVFFILDEAKHIGSISKHVVDLVNPHTTFIIGSLSGVLLHGVLLCAAGHVVSGPPVYCHITTHAQTVSEEAIVAAEASVEALEVRALHDTIVVEPAERE